MAFCRKCSLNYTKSEHLFLLVTSLKNAALSSSNFSTSTVRCKTTPHTVGVMSWVKSAYRRRYLERLMKEKPKSELQMTKEELLKRQSPKIEFFTTTRKGETSFIDESKMKNDLVVEPKVFFSDDKKTIICYHPPPKPYPISLTKRAVGQVLFGVDKKIFENFKESLSQEEVEEGKQLQEENPRLWNRTMLSILFKSKPDAVALQIPMTKSQHDRAKAEKEIYEEMSKMKRKHVRDLQYWERLRYMENTRGKDFVFWYKSVLRKPESKVYVPPKF